LITWLIPTSLFWTLAALYLGGAPIRFEGGGGGRQIAGLLLHFTIFLAVWWVASALLGALAGTVLSMILAAVLASALLPLLGRLSFRVVGVRIVGTEA